MKKIRAIETAVIEEKKLRVCSYCRVSMDQAEQKNSFSVHVGVTSLSARCFYTVLGSNA